MFDAYFIVDSIMAIGVLSLGLVTLLKDIRSNFSRTFFFATLSVAGWVMSNYFSNNQYYPEVVALIGNYMIFAFSSAAVNLVLSFSIQYTKNNKWKRRYRYLRYVLWILVPLYASPLVVKGIVKQENVYAIEFGPLALVYAVHLFGVMVLAMIVLWQSSTNAGVADRKRFRSLFRMILFSVPAIGLMQLILPAATGWFGITNLGALPIVIVIIGLYYAIAKQKLFNISANIVRSAAYFTSLSLMVIIFLAASSLLANIPMIKQNTAVHTVVNVVLIGSLLVANGPLIRAFKRISDRLFLQESYDPKVLLASLNKILISTIEIDVMLTKVASLLSQNIRPDFSLIAIKDVENQDVRVFSTSNLVADDATKKIVNLLAEGSNRKVIITEELGRSKQELKDELDHHNIAVVSWFETGISNTSLNKGYIMLGVKRNGYAYNSEDVYVLETVANELAIAVQNALHYEEIQRFNVTLQERVEVATRKLRMTNEKLRKMDETKDEFISMASHQLRTPLTSVKGYVSMVLDGDVGPISKPQRELLRQSFMSSERMANLISDLLNLSRINTGKFVIELKPTDIRKIIEAELGQLMEIAENKKIKLIYNAPKDFPALSLDDGKLHQVVMNLIDNALYYTPEGGTVNVDLIETEKTVEFRVTDNGIGVPRNEQKHLFTKMYRAENARRARPDGTGLGLFMVKKVIIEQKGAIIFESEEGKGSTFGFRFNKADHLVKSGQVAAAEPAKA